MSDSPRWCATCGAWGDHHTDRCDEFATCRCCGDLLGLHWRRIPCAEQDPVRMGNLCAITEGCAAEIHYSVCPERGQS